MASSSAVTQNRTKAKQKKMGKKRKNANAKNGTTPTQKKLFGD